MLSSRRPILLPFLIGVIIGLCLAYSLSRSGRVTLANRLLQRMPTPKPLISRSARLSSFSSYTDVEDQYFERLAEVHVKCNQMPHVGRSGDGGWEVCMAPAFKPKKPCLVYSFGVGNVWGFDEAMAKDYGCTVRTFDPMESSDDFIHYPGPVNFYKVSLSGSDRTPSSKRRFSTLKSLLTRFGEANRTLDLLKIDIEYSEWESLESMLATGVLERTKQLIFEAHTKDVVSVMTSKADYLLYHKLLDGIESLGFRRFFYHENPACVAIMATIRNVTNDAVYIKSAKLRRTCCHELHYVNMHFATNMTDLTVV